MQEKSAITTVILTIAIVFTVLLFIGMGIFLVRAWVTPNGQTAGFLSNPPSCPIGQTAQWTGSDWICVTGGDQGLSALGVSSGVLRPEVCGTGEYSRWNGSAWVCATDRVGAGGTVTQYVPTTGQTYYAGPGITISGNVISATNLQSCGTNQYSRWNGTSWSCYYDQSSGSSGSYYYDNPYYYGGSGSGQYYYAGNGIRLSGNTFYTDAQSCSSGQYSRWTGSSWVCETDRVGSGGGGGGDTQYYYAGNGLTLSGSTFSLSGLQSCSSNQYSRWTGSQWTCGNLPSGGDGGGGSGGSYFAGNGIRLSGGTFSIDSPTCSSGQFSRWNGSNWTCATPQVSGEAPGGGLVTDVTPGGSIDLSTFKSDSGWTNTSSKVALVTYTLAWSGPGHGGAEFKKSGGSWNRIGYYWQINNNGVSWGTFAVPPGGSARYLGSGSNPTQGQIFYQLIH